MSEAWRSYPGAPAPGADLCGLDDLPQNGTHSVSVGDFSILLVRVGPNLHAFVNACPHQYLPLDYRAKDVLSADRGKLICSNHDAVFDAETGEGLGGFARGCELDVLPVDVRDGRVVIAT